mgnify:CR=1 FL=1
MTGESIRYPRSGEWWHWNAKYPGCKGHPLDKSGLGAYLDERNYDFHSDGTGGWVFRAKARKNFDPTFPKSQWGPMLDCGCLAPLPESEAPR